ncbi:hypothetical protein C810_04171 [Lachnospiraceae bacterium A2]|nr:hypothetical protein C810_04171 [Lachnospiraceae bacterium A2]
MPFLNKQSEREARDNVGLFPAKGIQNGGNHEEK